MSNDPFLYVVMVFNNTLQIHTVWRGNFPFIHNLEKLDAFSRDRDTERDFNNSCMRLETYSPTPHPEYIYLLIIFYRYVKEGWMDIVVYQEALCKYRLFGFWLVFFFVHLLHIIVIIIWVCMCYCCENGNAVGIGYRLRLY